MGLRCPVSNVTPPLPQLYTYTICGRPVLERALSGTTAEDADAEADADAFLAPLPLLLLLLLLIVTPLTIPSTTTKKKRGRMDARSLVCAGVPFFGAKDCSECRDWIQFMLGFRRFDARLIIALAFCFLFFFCFFCCVRLWFLIAFGFGGLSWVVACHAKENKKTPTKTREQRHINLLQLLK